jgi:hypothetical protein
MNANQTRFDLTVSHGRLIGAINFYQISNLDDAKAGGILASTA